MANNQPTLKETTTHSQHFQHNNMEMPYSSQQEKSREKPQQADKPKKTSSNRLRPMENEKDRQKAETEKSRNELKNLLTQFGTKAKANEELEKQTTKLRNNLADLMNKVRNKKPMSSLPPPSTTTTTTTTTTIIQTQPTSENKRSLLISLWNGLISIVLFTITLIRHILETLYRGLNLRTFLFVILFVELFVVILIWTVKRTHHTYLYVEPYEAVVHGTLGVDQSDSWNIFWSIITSIQDFFAEVMNGGRGFGSPSYDGFVPT